MQNNELCQPLVNSNIDYSTTDYQTVADSSKPAHSTFAKHVSPTAITPILVFAIVDNKNCDKSAIDLWPKILLSNKHDVLCSISIHHTMTWIRANDVSIMIKEIIIFQSFSSHFPVISQSFPSHFPVISQSFSSHFPDIFQLVFEVYHDWTILSSSIYWKIMMVRDEEFKFVFVLNMNEILLYMITFSPSFCILL